MVFSLEGMQILLVGHVSIDLRDNMELPGGPPLYQIPIIKAFGIDQIDVLTSTTNLNIFHQYSIKVHNVKSEHDTVFSFRTGTLTGGDDRELVLKSKANDISENDLPKLGVKYDIIVISGIAGEITLEEILKIRKRFPDSLLCVDVQSLVRSNVIGEAIKITKLTRSILRKLNQANTVVRGSYFELENIKDAKFAGLLIRTKMGELVEYVCNEEYGTVTLDKVDTYTDGTGSGDIFLISLALNYLKFKSIRNAIGNAHKITRDHLMVAGIPTLLQSKEIVRRYI